MNNTKTIEDYRKQIEENDILRPHLDLILSTVKDFIAMKATKPENLELWQSKLGGHPYLPKSAEYPKDSEGNYLTLLLQINFEEVPHLAGLSLPEKGILQLFVQDSQSMGMPDEPENIYFDQKDFRTIYYPEVKRTDLVEDFLFLPELEHSFFVKTIKKKKKIFYDQVTERSVQYGLEFCIRTELLLDNGGGEMDYKFEKTFQPLFPDDKAYWEFQKAYMAVLNGGREAHHQIGGYGKFAQYDPRSECPENLEDNTIHLVQIDNESFEDGMELGLIDCGTVHLFISEEGLKNKDFSKTAFYWDFA